MNPTDSLKPTPSSIYFASDGRSLVTLPTAPGESLALIDNSRGDFRLLHFSTSDAEAIADALHRGATFVFRAGSLHLHLNGPGESRRNFEPVNAAPSFASVPATPDPAAIQRLIRRHDEDPKT